MSEFYIKLKQNIVASKDTLATHKYNYLYEEYVNNNSTSLSALLQILKNEEAQLKKDSVKSYPPLIYDNDIISFLQSIMIELIVYVNHFIEEPENLDNTILSLFNCPHLSYTFYKRFYEHTAEIKEKAEKIKNHPMIGIMLYMGLLEFYEYYYGDFSNNQNAIEQICVNYPKQLIDRYIDNEKKNSKFVELVLSSEDNTYDSISNLIKNKIIKGIISHIRTAATPNNIGFAYYGIDMINKYIENLPNDVIIEIIDTYLVYMIVDSPIYRNQVYSLINSSTMNTSMKKELKFLYLDCIIIANIMTPLIEPGVSNLLYPKSRIGLPILEISNSESTDKCWLWRRENNNSRYAFRLSYKSLSSVNPVDLYSIEFDKTTNEIVIYNLINKLKKIRINYNYNDYTLYDLTRRNFVKCLEPLFQENNQIEHDYKQEFTFSLVYLNNYRGLKHQCIEFDHRYSYDNCNNQILVSEEGNETDFHLFYGKNIYSTTCIVGKNGTGKTSTIDFLRDTFFKILKLVNQNELIINEEGILDIRNQKIDFIDQDTNFLVVFRLKNKDYFLTNILQFQYENSTSNTNLFPYTPYVYLYPFELSKIIYFSNAINLMEPSLFWTMDNVKNNTPTNNDNDYSISKEDYRVKDYSEKATFQRKKQWMDKLSPYKNTIFLDKYTNKELLYQLYFIGSIKRKELNKLIGLEKNKQIYIVNRDRKILITNEQINQFVFGQEYNLYSDFINKPESYLAHFSAGQYAKLNLMAKLYWFLYGYKFLNKINTHVDKNEFDEHEFLYKGESVLIFMDECELYMHPEWQRRLIYEWLKFINKVSFRIQVQLVLTTNSPFLLSDLLSHDVHYLPGEICEKVDTFAQNIHRLLMRNFFMENTIGAYSKEMILKITKLLQTLDDEEPCFTIIPIFLKERDKTLDIPMLINIIQSIGEPIYQEQLLEQLFTTKYWKHYNDNLNKEREIHALEKRLRELKES